MKKLLKQYGVESHEDLYSLISVYFRKGNLKMARNIFLGMPKRNRIEMTKNCLFGWHTITTGEQVFYFNLLTGLTS